MERIEKIVGNVFATILILVIFWGISMTIFSLLFRDGRGVGMYGNRGNSYMYDDY
jgi:hypothetical protein